MRKETNEDDCLCELHDTIPSCVAGRVDKLARTEQALCHLHDDCGGTAAMRDWTPSTVIVCRGGRTRGGGVTTTRDGGG